MSQVDAGWGLGSQRDAPASLLGPHLRLYQLLSAPLCLQQRGSTCFIPKFAKLNVPLLQGHMPGRRTGPRRDPVFPYKTAHGD